METDNADGQSLYKMLLSPAATLLHPQHTPVIILADGILSPLNFETLLVPGAAAGTAPGAVDSNVRRCTTCLATQLFRRLHRLRCWELHRAHGPGKREDTLDWQPGLSGSGFIRAFPWVEMSLRIEGYFSSPEISTLEGQQATPAAYLASVTRTAIRTFILFPTPSPASASVRWIRRSFFQILRGT